MDINEYSNDSVRRAISYVPQGIELFSKSISDEVEYIDGGMSVTDAVLSRLFSVVGSIISSKLLPYCSLAVGKAALAWAGASANAIWAGITSAAVWIWNSPVALGILMGVVGITATIFRSLLSGKVRDRSI